MIVTPSDDLKRHTERDSFQLIDPETAGIIFFCALVAALIIFK